MSISSVLAIKANRITSSGLKEITEDVGENLVRFTDKNTNVICYYVNGFPEGLSCVKQ